MNDKNGFCQPGTSAPPTGQSADSTIVLPSAPARTRRAVLGSALGLLGVAATGCSKPKHPFDPASETLPPDPSVTPSASAAARFLDTGAADFFGKGLIPQQRATFGLDRAQILPSDDPRFQQIVRVSLPAGDTFNDPKAQVYNDGNTYGGSQLFVAMEGRPTFEMYLRYYVRFPHDFDFRKGGKLPGFYGVIYNKGNDQRTDSDRSGFASRFAWRKEGEGIVYSNTARPDAPVKVSGKKSWTWELNKWICVEQGVRMNFETFSQGLLDVWIDNKETVKEHGYNPRISDKVRIGGIMFSAVYGGGDRSFAPETGTTIDFAAFAIGEQRVGPLPEAAR